ncbi:sialic acid-binding Ig-like lectin 14 [Pelmatolapia mariae]|uniref:sialic acid-binding Ig-like lectin 14 n=1 Tax=Pelmatolapia mariae TaxID=158779 RepID=UPI002FE60684
MFVLIWSALFVSVKGASVWGQQHCVGRYCVTLSERELTAEAGLCVVIPCSFTTADEFTPKHTVWYKCEASQRSCSDDEIFHSNKNTDKKAQSGFEGRVSRLEPDVSQNNCSIIINDLKESDSGSYQLRVTGVRNGQQDAFTFIPRVTVSVKGLKLKPTVIIPTLTEGQQATLTCTAPGLCSGSVPEITWIWRGAGGTESYITGNRTDFKTEKLTDVTRRHISTLTFKSSAEQHNTTVTCKIHFTGETTTEEASTLKVNYVKEVKITGMTSVREGNVLNLTCSVESFPPAHIVWKKVPSTTNLQTENTDLHNDTGSATLVTLNVTVENSGQYLCTAKHLDKILTSHVNVTLTWHTKIQNGSGCVLQSDVLTCVCISEGFPLPTIKWPLLENHTQYTLITTVSNHTVNSTVSLTVKNHGNSTVECVSNNGNGEERGNLLVYKKHEQPSSFGLGFLKVTIAFLTGVLFSIIVCCLVKNCYRNGRKQESTNTEYAEIKKAVKEQSEDAEEEDELLDAKEDEMVVELEMKCREPENEEGGHEAVYSNVNDIINEI